jgi:hypothetical protein
MDKLTKAFVIAASSIVIAAGGVWLYQQYNEYQAKERCIKREIGALEDFFKEYAPFTETQKRTHLEGLGLCVD